MELCWIDNRMILLLLMEGWELRGENRFSDIVKSRSNIA